MDKQTIEGDMHLSKAVLGQRRRREEERLRKEQQRQRLQSQQQGTILGQHVGSAGGVLVPSCSLQRPSAHVQQQRLRQYKDYTNQGLVPSLAVQNLFSQQQQQRMQEHQLLHDQELHRRLAEANTERIRTNRMKKMNQCRKNSKNTTGSLRHASRMNASSNVTQESSDIFEAEVMSEYDEEGMLKDGGDITDEDDEINTVTKMDLTKYDFGAPTEVCPDCSAIMWKEERANKSDKKAKPRFSLCCSKGAVKLPLLKDAPDFLKDLLEPRSENRCSKFKEYIRAYNSMFAFTSTGGEMDTSVNDGKSPWLYKLHGQNLHQIGTLLPKDLDPNKCGFAQLYIYDTQNEIKNRKDALSRKSKKKQATNTKEREGQQNIVSNSKKSNEQNESAYPEVEPNQERELDDSIIQGLIKMLDEFNVLARIFRVWRDRYTNEQISNVGIRLIGTRRTDSREYALPTASEVAALYITGDKMNAERDIIVHENVGGLKRISEIHPSYMALQYPLLFPYGEDGYHPCIPRYGATADENYNAEDEVGDGDEEPEDGADSNAKKRKNVTMREYYAYRIQIRRGEGQTLARGGRLFQQYLVDSFTSIEEARLRYVKDHQKEIFADLYQGIRDAIAKGDTRPGQIGKRIVLPSTFTGGPRYMIQHYQDAIALCRFLGPPDLFITFTCNPQWSEISEMLKFVPGQTPSDRPDIVSRVFNIKLKQLLADLRESRHFGEVDALLYRIEFQKRGLPHAHILLWLQSKYKPKTAADIDRIISAELPDPVKDPIAFAAVSQAMIHGPCGASKYDAPCMVNRKCSKKFPKKYSNETTTDRDGYPVYKRRDNGRGIMRDGIKLDNSWVVPHNRALVTRYNAHINVEVCNSRGMSIKYLFKYLHKGGDRVTAVLQTNRPKQPPSADTSGTPHQGNDQAAVAQMVSQAVTSAAPISTGMMPTDNSATGAQLTKGRKRKRIGKDNKQPPIEKDNHKKNPKGKRGSRGKKQTTDCEEDEEPEIDEINIYKDCRYVAGSESSWRILNFPIQYRNPSVERLPFHLEGGQYVYFNGKHDLKDVVKKIDPTATKFLRWFDANRKYPEARKYTYVEFPMHFTWCTKKKEWNERKRGRKFGRIYYVNPACGERYYLRILLNVVKGPLYFDDIKTFEGVLYNTYKEACIARRLLEDDNEWHKAIREAATFSSGAEVRKLFVTLLVFCQVTAPGKLWTENWECLCDGIEHDHARLHQHEIRLEAEQIKNIALQHIEMLMKKQNRSLAEEQFNEIPFPNMSSMGGIPSTLIMQELDYDKLKMQEEFEKLRSDLNAEQKHIYESIIDSVENKEGKLFFVYGSGGTGKTYLWKTIISSLRARSKIVLAVASSGIASLLLPGGRTAHSRFKIPLKVYEDSSCNVVKKDELSNLLAATDLIIWDEAPMANRHALEALNKTLVDIMTESDDISKTKPFGGKTVALGGDFRQILPVITKGSRADTVDASISRSPLWKKFKIFKLTKNMRLFNGDASASDLQEIDEFAKWVLDVGDGKLPAVAPNETEEKTWVKIPDDLLIECDEDHLPKMVESIYPNLIRNMAEPEYLENRSILAPTNQSVKEINDYMIAMIPSKEYELLSADSIDPESDNYEAAVVLFPKEFLNSIEMSGMPSHKLCLKEGVPVMLLRNLDQTEGLCNGTRMVVKHVGTHVIQATVLTGKATGKTVLIPRIVLAPTDTDHPFILRRRQFPIKVSFAMTINKSQGQSLPNVGIYLDEPVFSHGQLYVAVSRTTTRRGLKIVIKDQDNGLEGYTRNMVYYEIFNNLV